jgi:hypothetical protein
MSIPTAILDPELPFKIRPMNGREARESDLRLKASGAPKEQSFGNRGKSPGER